MQRRFIGRGSAILSLGFAAMILWACSVPAAAAGEAPEANVTLLVYMNGSDLESKDGNGAATADLQEMMDAGTSGKVNVVIETGGTQAWVNPNISNEENQRWHIGPSGLELVSDNLGSRNMGDPATLKDFVTWSIGHYPAQKYALVFWDHGGGAVNGFGADELHDGDSLLLPEIDAALREAAKETQAKFELVGFDACLMGTLETASIMKKYANYLVASEELEPGHGWNYTPIVSYLQKSGSSIDGSSLGKVIVDGYKGQASDEGDAEEITLSVTDLTKVDAVEKALDSFITKAASDISRPEGIQAIAKARSKSEDYGSGGGGDSTDMVDLTDLAKQASSLYPNEAKALIDSIKSVVSYSVKGELKPGASGLSIYFPFKDKVNFSANLDRYRALDFSKPYRDFVEAYVGKLTGDRTPIRFDDNKPKAVEKEVQGKQSTEYTVHVKQEDTADITEAYSVLAKYEEGSDSKVIFLGMDAGVTINKDTGELEDSFSGQWVTLDGHFVSMFLDEIADDFSNYSIPAKLNGQKVDIQVKIDEQTGEGTVIGAWRGIDPHTGQADKNILKLNKGDRIVPQFYYYDVQTEKDGFTAGKEFTVQGKPKLEFTDLPDDHYLYGFYLLDTAQNESYSDFVEVDVSGGAYSSGENGAKTFSNEIRVTVNGQLKQFEQPPILIKETTMVPLRGIFEALGAKVDWDGDTQTVTATKGNISVQLQIGNGTAKVNSAEVTLVQPAALVNGSTLVPVRFVSEALGAKVGWDAQTRTVLITQ